MKCEPVVVVNHMSYFSLVLIALRLRGFFCMFMFLADAIVFIFPSLFIHHVPTNIAKDRDKILQFCQLK